MKINIWIVILTSLVTSSVAFHRSHSSTSDPPSWETPKLPEITRVSVQHSKRARFHGQVIKGLKTTCGIDCQRKKTTQPRNKKELENELGYETLDMDNYAITNTVIEVGDVPSEIFISNMTAENEASIDMTNTKQENRGMIDNSGLHILQRRKRKIFDSDTRFSLPSRRYMTMFPFTTAVKISTGCSGVLLSPKHVLTSAHCIHDGKKYVKGIRKLKIGKLMKTPQKRRKGKRRNRAKKPRKDKRKKPSKNDISNKQDNAAKSRNARDLSLKSEPIEPYFKWVRSKKTYLPKGWLNAAEKNREGEYPIEFDYAVIELKRALGTEYMDIGISPKREAMPSGQRIHFTGFDTDRDNQMLYRFCAIDDETPDLMYHHCDAEEGTSGSGIYIRLYDKKTSRWSRKVIGIFSGHQWVYYPGGAYKEFNAGVRITPLKYAQICSWTKGNYEECRG